MKYLAMMLLAMACGAGAAQAGTLQFFSDHNKIDTNRWFISHGWSNGDIQSCEWRADAVTGSNTNIRLTLSDHGGKVRPIGCGELQTKAKNFGYGMYEARMRSAAGSGLNTAFFTYIGPPNGVPNHDEIDFEFLGKNPKTVQLNYYVDGKPIDPAIIPLGFDASAEFHTYSFVWEPEKIRWYIDGKLVHETKSGGPLPSHPGGIYLSLWSGSKIVDEWLGPFQYTKPVSAEYAWVKYTPVR